MSKFKKNNFYIDNTDGDIIQIINNNQDSIEFKVIKDPNNYWNRLFDEYKLQNGNFIVDIKGMEHYEQIYGYNTPLWRSINE